MRMIEVYVKTLWKEQVGIRERFVIEALERTEGILVRHRGEVMAIPAAKVREKVIGKSARRFQDYFGRSLPQHLYYFKWAPLVKQLPLHVAIS